MTRALARFIHRAQSAIRTVSRQVRSLAVVLLVLLLLLLTADFTIRYIEGGGVRGSHELASILVTNIYALCFLEVYRTRSDIFLEIVVGRLPERYRMVSNNFVLLVVMSTMAVVSFYSWEIVLSEWNMRTPTLLLPSVSYWLALALSTTMISVSLALDIAASLITGIPSALSGEIGELQRKEE